MSPKVPHMYISTEVKVDYLKSEYLHAVLVVQTRI